MVTTPPPEMAIERPPVKESRAGADSKKAERDGSGEPAVRRGKRRRNTRGAAASVDRFFLTRNGCNGIPELDHEVEDENTAMVEALKTGSTFIMLSEWRSTVDNTTKGRPVITKEAVSKAK